MLPVLHITAELHGRWSFTPLLPRSKLRFLLLNPFIPTSSNLSFSFFHSMPWRDWYIRSTFFRHLSSSQELLQHWWTISSPYLAVKNTSWGLWNFMLECWLWKIIFISRSYQLMLHSIGHDWERSLHGGRDWSRFTALVSYDVHKRWVLCFSFSHPLISPPADLSLHFDHTHKERYAGRELSLSTFDSRCDGPLFRYTSADRPAFFSKIVTTILNVCNTIGDRLVIDLENYTISTSTKRVFKRAGIYELACEITESEDWHILGSRSPRHVSRQISWKSCEMTALSLHSLLYIRFPFQSLPIWHLGTLCCM